MKITLSINNVTKVYDLDVEKKLLEVLRDEKLISVKDCCNSGTCGCCTVLFNNKPIPSCLITACYAQEASITTLEYFSTTKEYEDIENGFKQAGILLCGYCNAGKIFLTHSIISRNSRPTKDEILKAISMLECHCTEMDSLAQGIIYAAAFRRNRIGAKKNG